MTQVRPEQRADDWSPGEGWAPDEDREEYVDLRALALLEANPPADGAPA